MGKHHSWTSRAKQGRPGSHANGGTPAELKEKSRGERLQKVMADAGVGSRRACEQLIEEGVVSVNGHIVTDLPIWVDPEQDRILVNGRRIGRSEPPVYVMLFKPRGTISTNADPDGRPRAIDLINHPTKARLFPVGRLDLDSSGLLLLTNDGELANRLTHPRHEVHKIYEVTVKGFVTDEEVRKLEAGVFLTGRREHMQQAPGRKAGAQHLTILKRDRERTRLRLQLREGRNRQIRRMMAALGHRVKKLRRVQLGPLKLKGLRPGEWRDLRSNEVKALYKAGRSSR